MAKTTMREAAEYMGAISQAMSSMAKDHGFDVLAALYAMAALEAGLIVAQEAERVEARRG